MDLIDSPVADVQALGVSVFGDNEDMAQARITFENGAVANLSASRCSYEPQRTMQVYGSNGFISADLTARTMNEVTVPGDIQSKRVLFNSLSPEAKKKITEELFTTVLPKSCTEAEPANPILDEQADWIDCVQGQSEQKVPAADGIRNVELAKRILSCVRKHQWTDNVFGPRGPLVSIDQLVSEGKRHSSRRLMARKSKHAPSRSILIGFFYVPTPFQEPQYVFWNCNASARE